MEGLYQNFTQHAHIIGPCQSTVSSMPQLMRMKPSVIPTCGALKPKRPSTGVPHKCVNSWKKNWTPPFLHRALYSQSTIIYSLLLPINGIKVLMRSTRHSLLHPKKIQNAQGFCFVPQKNGEKKPCGGLQATEPPITTYFLAKEGTFSRSSFSMLACVITAQAVMILLDPWNLVLQNHHV